MENERHYKLIREKFESYITEHKLKSVVIGISGGIDSAIIASMLYDICTSNNVKIIGRFINIESNKQDEIDRANAIGEHFCHDYEFVDLTESYLSLRDNVFLLDTSLENERQTKIRLGNVKARMRMMYLYNLSQLYGGMVLDTDNKTEHNLGFWTLHGDVGDFTPLIDLWKTEVYALANYTIGTIESENAKKALQDCIDATPTDGLGITSSDVEQLGCKSYYEVDEILKQCVWFYTTYNANYDIFKKLVEYVKKTREIPDYTGLKMYEIQYKMHFQQLSDKYGIDAVYSIMHRHISSNFKRNNPVHVIL